MILITGGTGFIGKALIRHLVELDLPVRTLLRPSQRTPDLPRGVPVEIAVSSLNDERGLRSALVGVQTVYHLATAEWRGVRASLLETDIQGTLTLCRAAASANVERIFFLSHLGADRASAYPLLKAKAIAEEHIRRSGVNYTILRSGIVFGAGDHFTTGLSSLLCGFPGIFLTPGEGETLLQPLWVEDLAACLAWSLDNPDTLNQTYQIGGPEFLSLAQILDILQDTLKVRRHRVGMHPPYLRALTVFLENLFPNLPVSVYWLDYLAANRTASLDAILRSFQLMPSRFAHRLEYLRGENWNKRFWQQIRQRPQKQEGKTR